MRLQGMCGELGFDEMREWQFQHDHDAAIRIDAQLNRIESNRIQQNVINM